MYSAVLVAMPRYPGSWSCSYASRSASPTNVVHTRLGTPLGTTIVRVCLGKLYPQHHRETPCDRNAINLWIIGSTKSPVLATPIFESLRNADRNSAMALGFWVFGMPNILRILIGLRFRAWVKNNRGNLELRNGRAAKTGLLTASYGSCPAQSLA